MFQKIPGLINCLGWLVNGDCHVMYKMQYGGWKLLECSISSCSCSDVRFPKQLVVLTTEWLCPLQRDSGHGSVYKLANFIRQPKRQLNQTMLQTIQPWSISYFTYNLIQISCILTSCISICLKHTIATVVPFVQLKVYIYTVKYKCSAGHL